MMNRSGSADNKAHIDRNIPLENKPKDYLLKRIILSGSIESSKTFLKSPNIEHDYARSR